MGTRRKALAVATSIVVALVAVTTAACGDDDTASTTTGKPTTTTTTTSTTGSSTPTTTQPDTAVFPFASSDVRFTDPVEAARTFATSYLGFVEPVVGAFQQGDTRSGEVPVQAKGNGPVTTVLVRQLTSEDTWWVLGASTPNLVLQSPAAQAAITSPVTLSGQSTAFEATVNVEIRQDGTRTPLKEDIVNGGANGEMGPFSKAITFPAPSAPAGAIVLKTLSAEDGNITEASVVRVTFGG